MTNFRLVQLVVLIAVGLVTPKIALAQELLSPPTLLPAKALNFLYVPKIGALDQLIQSWGRSMEWDALGVFSVQDWVSEEGDFPWALDSTLGIAIGESPSSSDPGSTFETIVAPFMRPMEVQAAFSDRGPESWPVKLDPYLVFSRDRDAINIGPISPLACGLHEALLNYRISGDGIFGKRSNPLARLKAYRRLRPWLERRLSMTPRQARRMARLIAFKILPGIRDLEIRLNGKAEGGTLNVDCTFSQAKVAQTLAPTLTMKDQAMMLGPLPMSHVSHTLLPSQFLDHLDDATLQLRLLRKIGLTPRMVTYLKALRESLSGSKLSFGGYVAWSWGIGPKGLEAVFVVQVADGAAALDRAVEAVRIKPWRAKGLRWILGEGSQLPGLTLREATLHADRMSFAEDPDLAEPEVRGPIGTLEQLFNCPNGLQLRMATSQHAVMVSIGLSRAQFEASASALISPPSLRLLNEGSARPKPKVISGEWVDFDAVEKATRWIQAMLDTGDADVSGLSQRKPKRAFSVLHQAGSRVSLETTFWAEPALKRFIHSQ